MSLMQARRQEDLKYPSSTQLLKSSNDLGWSTLFAELRSHSRYEGPGAAASADAKIGIVVRGSDEGLATCKVAENLASSSRCCVSIGSRISSVSACACASRAASISDDVSTSMRPAAVGPIISDSTDRPIWWMTSSCTPQD